MKVDKKVLESVVLSAAKFESGLGKGVLEGLDLDSPLGENGWNLDETGIIMFSQSLEDGLGEAFNIPVYNLFEIPEEMVNKFYGGGAGTLRSFVSYLSGKFKRFKKPVRKKKESSKPDSNHSYRQYNRRQKTKKGSGESLDYKLPNDEEFERVERSNVPRMKPKQLYPLRRADFY